MGTLSCKYCNNNNNEEHFEQKIKENNPLLITHESQKKLKENYNINDFNNNNIEDMKSKNIDEKENDNNMEQNHEINNNININNISNSNDNIIDNNKDAIVIEENKEFNLKKDNLRYNLQERNTNKFSITNKKEANNKVKNFEINKIQFGIKKEDKEKFNQEQNKLYKEAEINLQQFYAPQGAEITKLQNLMSNILLKLNKIFTNIEINSNQNVESNYILLNASLKKMVNYEINAHKTVIYSERFCVLYPQMFKYYKSKEQFLKNLSPICSLPIDQISEINIAKPKKYKNKGYHLIICNKLGIQKDLDNSLLKASPDAKESLLIFTSDDEKNLLQWYIVFQYIIQFYKI